jgi:hypothetical protein
MGLIWQGFVTLYLQSATIYITNIEQVASDRVQILAFYVQFLTLLTGIKFTAFICQIFDLSPDPKAIN